MLEEMPNTFKQRIVIVGRNNLNVQRHQRFLTHQPDVNVVKRYGLQEWNDSGCASVRQYPVLWVVINVISVVNFCPPGCLCHVAGVYAPDLHCSQRQPHVD